MRGPPEAGDRRRAAEWRSAGFDPLAGLVADPRREDLLIEDVGVWDGTADHAQPHRWITTSDDRIARVATTPPAGFAGQRIDGSRLTAVPGFIDTHVHMMFDSGPDLLLNPAGLMARWYAEQERYVHDG